METAQNPAPEVTQPVIRMVPRSDLYVPDWNPRKYKNESEMQDLMAFMKSGRKPLRIHLFKLLALETKQGFCVGQTRGPKFSVVSQFKRAINLSRHCEGQPRPFESHRAGPFDRPQPQAQNESIRLRSGVLSRAFSGGRGPWSG